uniref:Atp6ap2 protein n=1 Tax=Fopius arisanus TaxID=64838 RepID=A0A0C9QIZ2_9HYME
MLYRLHVWTYALKGQVLIVRELLMTIHTLTSRTLKRTHTTLIIPMQDLNALRTHPLLSHHLVLVQEDPTITAPKGPAPQELDQVATAIHQQLLVIFLVAPDTDIFHIMSKWDSVFETLSIDKYSIYPSTLISNILHIQPNSVINLFKTH